MCWYEGDGMDEGVIFDAISGKSIATVHHRNMPLEEHCYNLTLIKYAPTLLAESKKLLESHDCPSCDLCIPLRGTITTIDRWNNDQRKNEKSVGTDSGHAAR